MPLREGEGEGEREREKEKRKAPHRSSYLRAFDPPPETPSFKRGKGFWLHVPY